MKALARPLLALVALAAWCGAAAADTLVINCGTVSGPTELVSAAVLCPQFPLPFPLSSISITITGGITGSITLTNGDNASTTAVGTTTTQFSVAPLAGFTIVNPIFQASFTTGNRILSASQTLTVAGLSANGNPATIGPNTTTFAPYVGAGFFDVPVSTATTFTGTCGGGFPGFGQFTTANATTVVTYTYTLPPP